MLRRARELQLALPRTLARPAGGYAHTSPGAASAAAKGATRPQITRSPLFPPEYAASAARAAACASAARFLAAGTPSAGVTLSTSLRSALSWQAVPAPSLPKSSRSAASASAPSAAALAGALAAGSTCTRTKSALLQGTSAVRCEGTPAGSTGRAQGAIAGEIPRLPPGARCLRRGARRHARLGTTPRPCLCLRPVALPVQHSAATATLVCGPPSLAHGRHLGCLGALAGLQQ